MIVTISEICKWAATDSSKRNFKGGEQVLKAGHIIKCGQIFTPKPQTENISIFSSCVRSSGTTTNKPHSINGKISRSGEIINFTCSCKAGSGERCKRIIATLLFCHS